MIYEYQCDRCGAVRTENLKMAEGDREFACDKEVEVGFALEGTVSPDGKLEMTGVSVVPAGTQADPNAKGKMKCGGTMKRIISLTSKMGHQWMP